MKEASDFEDSAAIQLGLRKRPTPHNLFTPSPLITPHASINARKVYLYSMNGLLDFDQEYGSTISPSSLTSLINIKIEDNNSPIKIIPEKNDEQEEFNDKVIVKIQQPKRRVTRSRFQTKPFPIEQSFKKQQVYKQQKRGRKRMYGELQDELVTILQTKSMSRIEIQAIAKIWAKQNNIDFTASNGWYQKFVNRIKKNHPQILSKVSKIQTTFKKKNEIRRTPNHRKKFISKN